MCERVRTAERMREYGTSESHILYWHTATHLERPVVPPTWQLSSAFWVKFPAAMWEIAHWYVSVYTCVCLYISYNTTNTEKMQHPSKYTACLHLLIHKPWSDVWADTRTTRSQKRHSKGWWEQKGWVGEKKGRNYHKNHWTKKVDKFTCQNNLMGWSFLKLSGPGWTFFLKFCHLIMIFWKIGRNHLKVDN